MTLEELKLSIQSHSKPLEDMTAEIKALWHAKKGQWELSHDIAQDLHTKDGSWIHAHLHRIEGDLGNAAYWYHMAQKPVKRNEDLDEEWNEIARDILKRQS